MEAKLKELVRASLAKQAIAIDAHSALGIWQDRNDLPADAVEASKQLREQMMRRTEAAE